MAFPIVNAAHPSLTHFFSAVSEIKWIKQKNQNGYSSATRKSGPIKICLLRSLFTIGNKSESLQFCWRQWKTAVWRLFFSLLLKNRKKMKNNKNFNSFWTSEEANKLMHFVIPAVERSFSHETFNLEKFVGDLRLQKCGCVVANLIWLPKKREKRSIKKFFCLKYSANCQPFTVNCHRIDFVGFGKKSNTMAISRNANFQFPLNLEAHKSKFSTQSYKSYFFFLKKRKTNSEKTVPCTHLKKKN